MLIIGCDYHPSFQQISCVDQETGEYRELRLEHTKGEAERFYRSLAGQPVRVGVEATGGLRWFERLLQELGFELWLAGVYEGSGICTRNHCGAEPPRDIEPPGFVTTIGGRDRASTSYAAVDKREIDRIGRE